MKQILNKIKKNWSLFAQFGVWIIAILSSFILTPQFKEYDTTWTYRFAQFLAASIIALMIIPIQRWKTKTDTIKWWSTALFLLIFGIIVLREYYQKVDFYTVQYVMTRTIVGDDENLLPEARANKIEIEKRKGIKINNAELVIMAAGKTETVWKSEVLKERRFNIIVLYICSVSLFTIFIISIIQAINCQSKKMKLHLTRISIILILTSILYSQNLPDRKQLIKMDKNSFDSALAVYDLNNSFEIESVITEEFRNLTETMEAFPVPLKICDEGSIFSHPTEGIILSRKELKNIFEKSNITQFHSIVSLILAHEYAHQIQFSKYKEKILLNTDNEMGRVYECQADMWAGKYLIENGDSVNIKESIKEALTILFDLGTEEFSFSNIHPSHENRRIALRFGMSYGMISKFKAFILDPNCPQNVKDWSKESINILSNKIDLKPEENFWDWSYRKSKDITFMCQICSNYLTLTSKKEHYDQDKNNPLMHYELTYKNTASFSLDVKLEVQSVTASINNKYDSMEWMKSDSRDHYFSLSPNQSYTVSDSLIWRLEYEKGMQLFIFPPSPNALISINCSICNQKESESKDTLLVSQLASNSITPKSELLLITILGQVFNSFKNIRIGPTQEQEQSIIYQSILQYPESYRTEINVNNSKVEMMATTYEGNNMQNALDSYEKHLKLIRLALKERDPNMIEVNEDLTSFKQIRITSSLFKVQFVSTILKVNEFYKVVIILSKS